MRQSLLFRLGWVAGSGFDGLIEPLEIKQIYSGEYLITDDQICVMLSYISS